MPTKMPQFTKLAAALSLIVVVCPAVASAQSPSQPDFPRLVTDPGVMRSGQSTWVPVFVLGDGELRVSPDLFSNEAAGGVLLGIAHVRQQSLNGIQSNSISPGLRWRVDEEISLGASMTVTDFIPCRSLMQTPLAPVQADACESFTQPSASTGIGIEGTLSFGAATLNFGYAEAPAIWVVPGALASQDPIGLGYTAPAVPMAPLGSLINETARTLTVGGELALNARSRVGVQLALSQIPRLENSPDIGRVQFSLAYGDFSADMATRMIRQGIETMSPWWGGMDLGVSWRTPWSGVISLGARNLVTSGLAPQLGETRRAEVSESDTFSRTPYVRYEQDF